MTFALPITGNWEKDGDLGFCLRHLRFFYGECPVCWREKEIERQEKLTKKNRN